jgi:hypothetical protein
MTKQPTGWTDAYELNGGLGVSTANYDVGSGKITSDNLDQLLNEGAGNCACSDPIWFQEACDDEQVLFVSFLTGTSSLPS